jgi:hypothetical protein
LSSCEVDLVFLTLHTAKIADSDRGGVRRYKRRAARNAAA